MARTGTTPTHGTTPTRGTTSRRTSRARRRSAARTAILTVALPSVATLGVFAAAASAVQGGPPHRPAPPRPAPAHLPPSPGPDAPSVAERAAREHAREDLTTRQERRQRGQEAERSHYALPVAEQGLSATFGEAGVHWSAQHTGIDFPVQSGTPVMAATDGVVTTHWSPAYGYLATVTAPDGTQTWYGHLRSYRIRKGPVRAGDVIAYSGSTGNSTGPHLHFEVRPGGGAPVDPLPWLLAHGLDPR